ncbi:hypothetical protein POM88_028265 [Heracleum sosnowskyi]|uniref:DUF6598 domain-containing protein n=1 Tax=Heracleum sosnowskyi TaxID=360622 RepID=A0AAD8IAK8_9APIA|nr:hypothetical protein POM88_028265 [Heracleum sosnowskyi]
MDDVNSMLEVFGILYLGRDDIEPQNQLGRITMRCPYGILRDMYNVTTVDETRETIKFGDEFDIRDIKSPFPYLHGPSGLEFDLFGGAYKGDLIDFFEPLLFEHRDEAFLEELRLDARDGTGEIRVLMGFYAHATIAQVEVRITNSRGNVVYGSVAASNNIFDHDRATSMFFLKDQHQEITVETDGLIPLARSRVAVPYKSVLLLDISLHVNGQPLSANMCFPARKIGVPEPKDVGDLSITVKWNALKHDSEDDMELD